MSSTQYGIRVTNNRFELSDLDDTDPLEILKIREIELEARKKTKLAEKENKVKQPVSTKPIKAVAKVVKQTENKSKEDYSGKPQNEKHERKFTGENRGDERANVNRNNAEERHDFKDEKSFEKKEWNNSGDNGFEVRRGRGGRGGSSFARGGRGGRGGPRQNFDSRGKRDFDRQSGSEKTGVKPIDKKEGGGARNWGTPKDDLDDTNATQNEDDWNPLAPEDTVEETNAKNAEPTSEDAPSGDAVIEEPQPEARELTLDEWKALKGPKQATSFNIRKANEGEDPAQWKKMYALRKKEEGCDDEEYEFDSSEYPQRVGRQKLLLDIDIHFKDTRGPVRGRGGRTGRGGNRDRQYQGGNSISNNASHDYVPKSAPAPHVDDELAFPSLR